MDSFELFVMDNLLARYPGHLFLHPQFDVGKGHSCPDFVALNLKDCEVWIVEVSTANNCRDLAEKIKNRENQYLSRVRKELETTAPHIAWKDWKFLVKVFVRSDSNFPQQWPEDVEVYTFDSIGFPWSSWAIALRKSLTGTMA